MVIYTCSYYTGLSNRGGISFLFYIKIITVEIQFYRFVLSFFLFTYRKYRFDKTKYIKTLLHWTRFVVIKLSGIEKAS